MYSNNPRRKHKSETTPPSQKTNGKPGNGRFGGPVHFKSWRTEKTVLSRQTGGLLKLKMMNLTRPLVS